MFMNMKRSAFTIRLSHEDMVLVKQIQQERNISSLNDTVSFLLQFYNDTLSSQESYQEVQHTLTLLKKYANQTRKANYVNTALLNAICSIMEIEHAGNHLEEGESIALHMVMDNYQAYMKKVMTRIKEKKEGAPQQELPFFDDEERVLNDE